jgi:4-oxalocrotonate tautomerase
MPVVQITIAEGRTAEQKRRMAERVTQAVVEELNTSPESITLLIYELGKDHIAKSGRILSEP